MSTLNKWPSLAGETDDAGQSSATHKDEGLAGERRKARSNFVTMLRSCKPRGNAPHMTAAARGHVTAVFSANDRDACALPTCAHHPPAPCAHAVSRCRAGTWLGQVASSAEAYRLCYGLGRDVSAEPPGRLPRPRSPTKVCPRSRSLAHSGTYLTLTPDLPTAQVFGYPDS